MALVVAVPGKGLGLVAQRHFSPGDLILSEEVALYCARDSAGGEDGRPSAAQARQIYQQFNRLGTREKFKVSKLFCVGDNSILNIFSTNSFTVNQSYCGLYVKTSRINHACDPNACYNNNGSLEKQVRAVREIAAGEEITISYISSNSDVRSIRWRELSCWGFQCSCAVCSVPGKVLQLNDSMRSKVKQMDTSIADFTTNIMTSLVKRLSDDTENLQVQDEEVERRIQNTNIYVNLPNIINTAEKRIRVIKHMKNELLLQNFSAHLDCLFLYLRARSLGILNKDGVERNILLHSDVVTEMAEWNIDWRHRLCRLVASAILFNVNWTFDKQ